MFKTFFALVGGAVIFVPILLILVAGIGSSGASPTAPAKIRKAAPVPVRRVPLKCLLAVDGVTILAATGFTAAFAAIVVGANAGAAWAVIPLLIWCLIVLAVRYGAQPRPPDVAQRKEASPPPRKKVSFGKDGVALLDRAHTAVGKVMASDAVKDGWLGPPDGIDLRADVRVIEDRLTRVAGIRQVIAELSRIPDPSDADRKREREAKQAEAKVITDANDRVKRLENLAREVQATAHELRLRSLTNIDGEDAGTSPAVVDSTRAMLSAYREVKGLEDLEPSSKDKDEKAAVNQKPTANGSQGLFDMLKQWWAD